MSMLTSLHRAYERMEDAPPFGYSDERIGVVIVLDGEGRVTSVTDWRDTGAKKRPPRPMLVPRGVKRTVGIAANFLWDKTAYALGLTAGEGKRLAAEHEAFVAMHEEALTGTEDEGLAALLAFLRRDPSAVASHPAWNDELLDLNVVFALEKEYRDNVFLHDRPAAKAVWASISTADLAEPVTCLVTGEKAPPARLHPSIKGIWGAQSSGASLISFNLDAFESYGHKQGMNAPVSTTAAFTYTTALNRMLAVGSKQRAQLGDATTVFWADATDVVVAREAESMFGEMLDPADEATEKQAAATQATDNISDKLERLRRGEPLRKINPKLVEGVRFFVLGLSPNAARVSVRFYFEDDFGTLAENYQRFCADIRIEPPPRGGFPPLWRYLRELAVLGKSENVPPNLAGEWMRSILTGTPYPLTLLSSALMRIRSDKHVNGLRAALLRAVLTRNHDQEVPVALDPEERDKGYVLGRLFAVYEDIQRAALGGNVNATVKDKFYGSASATPRKVFAMLDAGSANHLSKINKEKPGLRVNLMKRVGEIMELMVPADDPFPASLSAREQAMFGLGYYHEHNARFTRPKENDEADQP